MATVEQTLEEQNLEFYCDCIERKQNEGLKTKPRLKQIIWYRLGQRKDLGWDKVHQDLQKTPFCQRRQDTLELIKALPLELREKICTEYIMIKRWQRKMLGWDKVHQDLQKTPFCQRRQRLVKVMFCLEHKNCGIDGICVPCIRKDSINHYAFPDIDEYNSPRRCIEICDEDLEHTWILCKLRGLDPMREIFQKFY